MKGSDDIMDERYRNIEFLYSIRDIVAIEFVLAKNTTNRTINYLRCIVNKQMQVLCKELETLIRTVLFLFWLGARNQKYGPAKYPTALSDI